ncbi:MAG: EF-P lysine aminoacylase GenX [Deltaproteobacteria bacterium]|nr:EF-P lysine aminoacylase GenX [Deltaproteobacteria bacterium]
MSPASRNSRQPEPNWALARKQQTLRQRARILQRIRAFFVERDFLEVETPQRLPANAPETHIVPVPSGDWCLHSSPELCMKRLLAAGFEKLFQICHCWRGEERGSRHLSEFTMLEWYRVSADYRQLMEDCQQLLGRLAAKNTIGYQGRELDLSPPWERLTVAAAFRHHAPCSVTEALAADRFDELMALEIEPRLGVEKPVFLCDFPLEKAALARAKPDDPDCAERFELYLLGMELANGFSELTDPVEQRRRFAAEETARRDAGQTPYPLPEKFLTELPAMPDAAGIALGIDRLVMLLTDAAAIDEVVAFTPELL